MLDTVEAHAFWNKTTGLDPVAYEAHRKSLNPDLRECSYPPIIGARIFVLPLINPGFYARITKYTAAGFTAVDTRDDDHVWHGSWAHEAGLERYDRNGAYLMGNWKWANE